MIVGIDAQSLRALSEWPWPRRHHARLLQMLRAAAPKSVFIDIDFSSHSNEEDDALLERALADWSDSPPILASHFQASERRGQRAHGHAAPAPLRRARSARVRDSRARRRRARARDAQLVERRRATRCRRCSPTSRRCRPSCRYASTIRSRDSSFAYVSFIDVLNGRIDPAALRGKTVYVGPTAVELGDILTGARLPHAARRRRAGVRDGIGSRRAPPNAARMAARWPRSRRGRSAAHCCSASRGWRVNLAFVGAELARARGATLYLYAAERFVLEIVPFALVLVATFVGSHHPLARPRDLARARVRGRRQAPRRSVEERRRVFDRLHPLHRRARHHPHGEPRDVAAVRLPERRAARRAAHGFRSGPAQRSRRRPRVARRLDARADGAHRGGREAAGGDRAQQGRDRRRPVHRDRARRERTPGSAARARAPSDARSANVSAEPHGADEASRLAAREGRAARPRRAAHARPEPLQGNQRYARPRRRRRSAARGRAPFLRAAQGRRDDQPDRRRRVHRGARRGRRPLDRGRARAARSSTACARRSTRAASRSRSA